MILIVVASAQAQKSKPAADSHDSEIRAVYDRWAKAFEARDIDRIMAVYAPSVIAYDIVPLQYKGKDAYRKDYLVP